eukprot:CAMPEP_0170537284 /NCGR_PEP_ID=MMETSP0209-20121228/102625_1 /TAXON_ID=665100 ORGANISM="Litonotus pictus, Strain P1" /NCGR_SAMPLE_ID=MMETSP0209 /ASSEMBLY_ACC=CAM_ASM_000301 /LENGTH=129 /DNA_ID=CAMNT_0010838755 /DNA_START=282 /DNA_END=668 /DNA_ORIENTATION=+
MSCIIKPGCAQDIANSKYYSENNPYVCGTVDLHRVFLNEKSNRIVESHPKYDMVKEMIEKNKKMNSSSSSTNMDQKQSDTGSNTIAIRNEKDKREETSISLDSEAEQYASVTPQAEHSSSKEKRLQFLW